MVRLIPREAKFFDMFADMANNLTDGAKAMVALLNSPGQGLAAVATGANRVKDFEHRGDEMTHAVLRKLNTTFITPFDREDLHRLASSIDDVLDFLNAAAERMMLYKILNPPPATIELANIIVQQSEVLSHAIRGLEKNHRVLEHCVEVNRLEEEADLICRRAIGELFECEKDPITLIKFKELYEVLETATDKAEDVANVLEAVVLKSA
jgi:predicted phosphate transport protein (TIGR00153 family)